MCFCTTFFCYNAKETFQLNTYGSCRRDARQCPRGNRHCDELLNKEHRFYFAAENSKCPSYITEKYLVNGLRLAYIHQQRQNLKCNRHDIIPIAFGASRDDYERVSPPHSFIHVDDFANAKELANYLHYLSQNSTAYNEYFQWKSLL